jgi:hypothetical protein
MEKISVKLPKLGVNFYKIVVGVCFSLLWARVMYLIWEQPSYLTFIWFYIVIVSILLKWVLFVIIDRIHIRIRLKALRRELDESERRINEILKNRGKGENR